MPNARRLFADAVAGGDLQKFEKMMSTGQVGLEGVVKFLDLLGERAQPYMKDFYETITRASGRASKATENWTLEFIKGGNAIEGVTAVYNAFTDNVEASVGWAAELGDAFRRAGLIIAGVMLLPKEFMEWQKGAAGEDNFFSAMFGESEESTVFEYLKTSISDLKDSLKDLTESYTEGWKPFKELFDDILGDLSLLDDLIAPLIGMTGDLLRLILAFNTNGIPGAVSLYEDLSSKWSAKTQAEAEAREQFLRTGVRVPRSVIRDRADNLYRERVLSGEDKTSVGRFLEGQDTIRMWLTPAERTKMLFDGVRSGLEWVNPDVFTKNNLPQYSDRPSYNSSIPLGITDPTIPSDLRMNEIEQYYLDKQGWIGTPPLSMPSFESFYVKQLEDMALQKSDISGLLSGPSDKNISININGSFTVNGEIETLMSDVNIGEAIRGVLQDEIGTVIPQTGDIAK